MPFSALVVGPDAEALRVLRVILEERDLEVEHCNDAKLAEDRLASRPFAVVLVDCEDEPAAIELMVATRSTPANKAVLIVAMVDARNETRELFARGANFLLFKPVSEERVAESLQAAWSLLPSERRGKNRVHVSAQAAVSYATTADAPAPLLNLSEEGVALHSQAKMAPPCRVYFQFTLPGDPAIVRLSGDVVWQDARGHVGVHFTHVPKTSRRSLDGWFNRNRFRHTEATEGTPLILELSGAEGDEATPSAANLHPAAGTERRGQSRHSCRLGVNVSGPAGDRLQHCILTDMSGGGCYVETTQPLPVGASAVIEVRTQDLKLHVRGKVQSKHPGYGMGIEFRLKTAEERDQVRQLLAYQDNPEIELPAEVLEQI
jgi:CheY-like chemotaxis protein